MTTHKELIEKKFDELSKKIDNISNICSKETSIIKETEISIDEINTQFNEDAPSSSTVLSLMKSIENKEPIPPLLISPNKYLQDGRHRLKAYKNLGFKKVPVIFGYDPNVSGIIINGKEVELETKEYHGQKYKTPKINSS